MISYASTRMRLVNHSPTRAVRRAVIPRVESKYERFDCISNMQKFGVNLPKLMWTKTSAEITVLEVWALSVLFVSFKRAPRPQCKGIICQTKFGISDDVDVSPVSGNIDGAALLEWPSHVLALWFRYARPLFQAQLTWTKHTAQQSFSAFLWWVFIQVDPLFRLCAVQKERKKFLQYQPLVCSL